MKLILLAAILFAMSVKGQDIPCGTTAIIIRNVTFNNVCMVLLDSGYSIDKKDADLQTVSTQPRRYPKRFKATYVVNVRVKDSVAYFTTTFSAPADGSILRNEPSIYECKKNGKPIDNIFTYPFRLLDSFLRAFGKVEYKLK
jgi:hypothetical protein